MIKPIKGCAIGNCAKPCIYGACQYWGMVEMYCDECGAQCDEGEQLYHFEGKQLCGDCVLGSLQTVDPKDYKEAY